jgi:biopolymer transport protein ExbD
MRRRRRAAHQALDLNVIPLIDVVFFLLIFYVISTTFLREEAVTVERAVSSRATAVEGALVLVAVARGPLVSVGGRTLPPDQTQAAVAAALADSGATRVLVVPDREVPTGALLAVMDACTAAGAGSVQVAASAEPR